VADYYGTDAHNVIVAEFNGRVDAAYQQAPQSPYDPIVDDPLALSATILSGTWSDVASKSSFATNVWYGYRTDEASVAIDWFESFHVILREYDFGNLVSTQTEDIEVYSAFRRDEHDWDSLINNAGSGISLVGQPSLPYTFPPQTGQQMELQGDTDGPASVEDTLDFYFDVPQVIPVLVILERIVLFIPEPEEPYTERLQFITDVMTHLDGTEQRPAVRKNPRQLFEWSLLVEEGQERSRLHNMLFNWQSRTFGLPIWHDMTYLTADVAQSATTLYVEATDYADFREDDLVVIYNTPQHFDVHTLQSVASSTELTLSSGIGTAHSKGAIVAPVRTAVVVGEVSGTRFIANAATLRVAFRVTNNDIDIADTSAFDSYNSKVIINGHNGVRGQLQESFSQDVVVIDNETGISYQTSFWDSNRHAMDLTILAFGRQQAWETRQLMHALRGRQTSFYLCSFSKDLTPVDDLASGSNLMTIANVGYSRFVRQRQPRDVIRVVFSDGTAPIIRTVSSSDEDDADEETLTLNTTWPATYTTSQIRRVEFVQKVRYDSDEIRFEHERGARLTRVIGPVRTVLG
jgi:hypothetical protein